jgi:hypothetical protein
MVKHHALVFTPSIVSQSAFFPWFDDAMIEHQIFIPIDLRFILKVARVPHSGLTPMIPSFEVVAFY